MTASEKIWANSGDSHLLEPEDIWYQVLPKRLADRTPRTVQEGDEQVTYIGDQIVKRVIPSPRRRKWTEMYRPPGALRVDTRLEDLDGQGILSEVCFPSIGLWTSNLRDGELAAACARGWNDWAKSAVIDVAGERLFPTAIVSVLDTADAAAEVERAAGLGFRIAYLPTNPPPDRLYNDRAWEGLWTAAEAAGVVLAFHIGTGADPVVVHGDGGAVINYVETAYGAMRTVSHLVSCGALDRHPRLKVLIAEGGSSWLPALADRMVEGYRQYAMYVRPTLSAGPREIAYRQVYTTFQHDPTAVATVEHLGYRNVLWGSDYPHVEGTFPETQDVLHQLFDGVAPEVVRRITVEAFDELLGGSG